MVNVVGKLAKVVSYLGGMVIMYPGIKRLVEGPEVFLLNGQPGSEVTVAYDTPGFAFTLIGIGCLIMILGEIVCSALARKAQRSER